MVIGNEGYLFSHLGCRLLHNLIDAIMIIGFNKQQKSRQLIIVRTIMRASTALLPFLGYRAARALAFFPRIIFNYFNTKRHLADGFFPETIQFFVGFLKGISLLYCEDNNGIASIFAIKLICSCRLQKAVGLPKT